ncbi:phytoene/squalene synthase family protein [Balneolales bacterium ANBcel1]|nr:phytoene/squalene synthase family protein [Balneolales bacterium ANBcel1]
MDLYSKTSFEVSRLVTNRYSTSFSMGIRLFARKFREPVYALYGFVRLADEIVDTFHGHDKKELIERFRADTSDAIERKIAVNPILHSFQKTVNRYGIEREHIDAFFFSMELDLTEQTYGRELFDRYVYGSAEVVGLMCLRIFCEDDDALYTRLKPHARALGAAFQKVNFLRDIQSDLNERKRIYLPDVPDPMSLDEEEKRKFESEIEEDFRQALPGIKALPASSRLGVYLAYVFYSSLFSKIRKKSINELMARRVRLSNIRKMVMLIRSLVTVRFLR